MTTTLFSCPASVGRRLFHLHCFLLFALLLTGCGDGGDDRLLTDPEAKEKDQLTVHDAPPADWTIPVLDYAGYLKLREQAVSEGKVLVIDHWATWCGNCLAMFPKLHEAMAQRSDKVLYLSLCHDENEPGGEDYLAKARDYLIQQHAWQNAYLVDPSAKDAIQASTSANWDGSTLPAVFVFDPAGGLVFELEALRGEPADWVAQIVKAADAAVGR